jgi:hypothetical protein
MKLEITNIESIDLFISNKTISGKILEISKTGEIICEVTDAHLISASEISKEVTLHFTVSGKKYFVIGKMFLQYPHRIIVKPERDISEEKRQEERVETPSLSAKIIYVHKFLRQKQIKAVIINMSLKGARIQTSQRLNLSALYNIETYFPYLHQKLPFKATFCIKNHFETSKMFSYGIFFTNLDISSENNLKRYLFGGRLRNHY